MSCSTTPRVIRESGHDVFLPTLAGNAPGDRKDVGLAEAIDSAVAYINREDLNDFVLAGHSYGGKS